MKWPPTSSITLQSQPDLGPQPDKTDQNGVSLTRQGEEVSRLWLRWGVFFNSNNYF